MKGLEALNYLYNDLRLMKCLGVVEEVKVKSAYEYLKQTLLKAQEQEKKLNALEIIKNKKVNIYHIWVFDNYQQYKEHYPFGEYHAEEDMLTFKEFIFLKEVFGYEK